MQRLEVSGAVWPIYGSLGFKRLTSALSSNELHLQARGYFALRAEPSLPTEQKAGGGAQQRYGQAEEQEDLSFQPGIERRSYSVVTSATLPQLQADTIILCCLKKKNECTLLSRRQWRTERGFGVFNPPPKFRRPSKIVPKSPRLWKLLKIAEFRMPTPQDLRKKGSKILKLTRFAIVLH